jgi:hypothetical protein
MTISEMEIVVGPQFPVADGVGLSQLRGGKTGELIVGQAHAPHYEAVSRGNVFTACNQSVVTAGTALTSTGVTFHLCNPPGSGINMVLLQTAITLVTDSTPGQIVYAATMASLTAVTAGTALTVYNTLLNGGSGIGLAKSATTLPATPVAIRPLVTGETAAGIASLVDYVDGAIILSPGSTLSLQGITIVATFLASMVWEEVKIAV